MEVSGRSIVSGLERPAPIEAAHVSRRPPSIWRVLTIVMAVSLAVVYVIPLYYMVATALMSYDQLYRQGIQLIPSPPVWLNYPTAVSRIPFMRYLSNTLMIAVGFVLGSVLSSSLVGYSFARIPWKGRDAVFILVLATMMLPPQVTMVPVFIVFRQLGLVNTYVPLILPAFLGGSPFYIFLMRQYMRSVPGDLSDAARIDGCSEFRTFWNVILPLCRPAQAAITIFAFVATWNDFLHPLIYLTNKETKTLALGLYSFMNEFGIEVPLLMAAGSLVLAPILIIFFASQRYFIQGIALTGLKG